MSLFRFVVVGPFALCCCCLHIVALLAKARSNPPSACIQKTTPNLSVVVAAAKHQQNTRYHSHVRSLALDFRVPIVASKRYTNYTPNCQHDTTVMMIAGCHGITNPASLPLRCIMVAMQIAEHTYPVHILNTHLRTRMHTKTHTPTYTPHTLCQRSVCLCVLIVWRFTTPSHT